MKKSYIHFLIPVVLLIAFIAVYWNFSQQYEAKVADRARVQKEAKLEKLREEERSRKKAVDDALVAQEKRKVEKAAKEAKEKEAQEYRASLEEARRKANRDQFKLEQTVDRLKRDVKIEQDAIAKIEEAKKAANEEQQFLKTYVKQAEANTKSLSEVLEKIVAADAARAQAEALAAKAKNS